MKIRFLIFCMFFVSQNYISAQDKTIKVINYLGAEMKKQKIPGCQLVIIKDKKILLSKAFGIANVSFSMPVKTNTIFSINSIAKVFTSVAIMQLEEQNKLNIQDSISLYIDSIPASWNKITIKQLLSHTSGLPDIEDERDLIGGKGQDSAWFKVKKLPLLSNAGEKFYYNATNYFILQHIIEKCSGLDFETFVRKNQFDLAGMTSIYYANSYDVIKNKSPTYSYYFQDKITNEYSKTNKLVETHEEFPTKMKADAGAFTTAEEMTKWILALQSGKLLKDKEKINEIWNPVKLNNGTFDGFGGILNAYALGWPVINRKKHPAVAPIGGGRAAFVIYTKDNLTILLFTNLTGSAPQDIIEEIAKFYIPDLGS
ncbi:beta-lactamase family protein [Flavobacterium sp. JLP]|nr:beta-lactamase family protein [Flavobacterium sp. JLP]